MERGHFLPGRALVGHPSAVVPRFSGQRSPQPQVRRHGHAVRAQTGQMVEAQRGQPGRGSTGLPRVSRGLPAGSLRARGG